ncbi:GNAT family N-acetyltransferase [Paenibacillus gansuensis]|uniref:Enhanced intracellular survival protein Eis n=1 Tax=Paenibacillus gansuensis TaxID=306542 RepID=A0ABW5PIS3_9BACL
MELRQLTLEEFDQSMDLSSFAFQYPVSEDERESRRKLFKPERIWGYFELGQLMAKAGLLPFTAWIQGKAYAMGGIAGVATWPEYRRRGLVAGLLKHLLQNMRDQGYSVSFLHPFEFSFYRKYGWETYCEYKNCTIETSKLPERTLYPGRIERIQQDASRLNPIYEQYASKFSGTIHRDADWWEQAVFARKGGQIAVYSDSKGEDQGYVLYEVKERKFHIRELAALNDEAENALWTFIANHDSMIEKVEFRAPVSDGLSFKLSNPRIRQEITPYFMARIVDMDTFLQAYPFLPSNDEEFISIQVRDEHASWNEGVRMLRLGSGGQVTLLESGPNETPALQADIQSWTALFMGYKRPAELHRIGRLQGALEDVLRLDKRIPAKETYLMDFF